MRRLFSAIMLVSAIASTTPLQAQQIRVQSGDHAGFTRLVLPIGADREWELDLQPDGQWLLALDPAVDGFDTSEAFTIIQRTRLADLTATQTLSLSLACACDVTSFRYDTRFLVIDITDPDPAAPAPEPVAVLTANDPEAEARLAAAEALPDLAALLRSPGELPEVTPLPAPDAALQPELPRDEDSPNPRLAEAAQIMAEQLARAAASGLLDAALNEPMTLGDPTDATAPSPDDRAAVADPVVPDTPETSRANDVTPDPHPDAFEFPAGPLPIRAETAFDTVAPLELPIGPPSPEESCEGVPFNVADWSDGNGFHHGLGDLRRNLYDARDVLTNDGTIGLAQHYLYYGFGAEASYWLGQMQGPPEELLHVAALVDGAESAPFLPVESTQACTDGELLWRYLAGAVSIPLEGDDTAAIQRAFGELPSGLRDHMGPRLATRLVDDGYVGTARNIRDALHRGGRIDEAALSLLDLEMGIPLNAPPDETQRALSEALRNNGADPANVLAHALAFDRSIGTLPLPSRLVAADALIREIGNGPETDDLWRETLLGHAALGQIDEALSRLGDPARNEAVRTEALTELIADRVNVGDTAALVILAYTYGRNWRPEGSAAGRIQVRAITALRNDGLFEAAQILRDVRRPLVLPAPEATPAEAEDDATIAWEEGDWARLAEHGSGSHAAIAERLAELQTTPATTPTPTGPPDLDSLSRTLTDSRNLRSAVADLLARPALP